MKKNRKITCLAYFLVLVLVLSVIMSGCGKSSPAPQEPDSSASGSSSQESTVPDSPSQESSSKESSVPESSSQESSAPKESEPESPDDSGSEMTPAEKAEMSERAMENFLNKILAGNYTMTAEGFQKTNVYSEDLVWFDYEDDELYSDFAVMSVNNEVFQGFLTEDSVRDVSYLREGNALETSKQKLPSYWLEDVVSEGNIYNVFYNDTEDPLKFVSYDPGVQNQLRSLVGYGEVAIRYMHEVYLTLDAEDPAEAHLQAVVDSDEVARYFFDDIDITITFGNARSDTRAEAWMKDPVYPEARTEWRYGDIFVFNSIFLPGYGEQAVPFIPSASYALVVDDENFLMDDAVYIRDPHATEKDIEDYIGILAENGFEEYTEDGETTYRKLLREEAKCYSSISLEYDSGLNLTAKKAYDFPKYEGLDEINGMLADLNFAQLPETEDMTDFTAADRKWEQTESWLYLYDYYAVLYVTARYSDHEKAMQYLDAYVEELKADGFTEHYSADEIDYYQSPDESANFRYHFEDDGEKVILLYKAEKCLDASEAQTILSGGGFPEIDFADYLTGRNTVKFLKTMYGRDYDPSVSLTWKFDTAADGEAFLDQLVADLEEDGFYRVPASDLGSRKENGYTNEEKGLGTAFDFIPREDGGETYIYFDFRGGIDFDAEPIDTDDGEEDGGKPILGWKHADDEEVRLYG